MGIDEVALHAAKINAQLNLTQTQMDLLSFTAENLLGTGDCHQNRRHSSSQNNDDNNNHHYKNSASRSDDNSISNYGDESAGAFDVILVGDMFYDEDFGDAVLAFLRRQRESLTMTTTTRTTTTTNTATSNQDSVSMNPSFEVASGEAASMFAHLSNLSSSPPSTRFNDPLPHPPPMAQWNKTRPQCMVLIGDPGRWFLSESLRARKSNLRLEKLAEYELLSSTLLENRGFSKGFVWRLL